MTPATVKKVKELFVVEQKINGKTVVLGRYEKKAHADEYAKRVNG